MNKKKDPAEAGGRCKGKAQSFWIVTHERGKINE